MLGCQRHNLIATINEKWIVRNDQRIGAHLNQGHEGKIYQASNWVFVGKTGYEAGIMLKGKLTHRRTINSKYGTSDIGWL